MKNKVFKIVLALVFAFCIFGFFGFMVSSNNKVYAAEIVDSLGEESNQEEQPSNDEKPTEETAVTENSLTEEEKSKLDQVVEWVSKLNKEELLEVLATAKNWLIAGGIVTVISILSAVIGLIAAVLKLNREKIKNSNLSEENKQKILDVTANFENKLVEGNNQIKALLLEFVNNMSDDEKKAMEANISDVRTKIELALQESNKNE